jgi:NAD(P)-dependent dehydrogenase (short-subunit alcohol dehydrogenase family)
VVSCLGRIVQISSGSASNFVAKCSQMNKDFFVNKNVTWSEIEERIIAPFLKICEDESKDDEQKKAANTEIGLGDSPYGMSKACVNAYTLELSKRFPSMLINSCSPGWIQTDMTLPYAKKMGRTPEEMGIAPVEKGTVAANYLMMGDLEGDITGYESGRYYGSDAKWSPFHKYRSPGTAMYDGTYP